MKKHEKVKLKVCPDCGKEKCDEKCKINMARRRNAASTLLAKALMDNDENSLIIASYCRNCHEPSYEGINYKRVSVRGAWVILSDRDNYDPIETFIVVANPMKCIPEDANYILSAKEIKRKVIEGEPLIFANLLAGVCSRLCPKTLELVKSVGLMRENLVNPRIQQLRLATDRECRSSSKVWSLSPNANTDSEKIESILNRGCCIRCEAEAESGKFYCAKCHTKTQGESHGKLTKVNIRTEAGVDKATEKIYDSPVLITVPKDLSLVLRQRFSVLGNVPPETETCYNCQAPCDAIRWDGITIRACGLCL